jgi:hypothetical protein
VHGCELLGCGAVGAGGVPAAAFATGERVDAFVDNGVEPGALLHDVALHDDHISCPAARCHR